MQVTGFAQQQAWAAGMLPPVEEVRTGTWSIPVPIPDNPLRYTLAYALEGRQNLVVVDPGWDSDQGWLALRAGLALIGADVDEVSGVVVTHVHADHLGLAGRVRAASGAWVAMHPAEIDALPRRFWDDSTGEAADARWLRSCGVPVSDIPAMLLTPKSMTGFLALVEPDVLLEDGELVPLPGREVRAIWTPGHTPGHLCFHDATHQTLLTGDHLLPRITPNIGAEHCDRNPPLAAYLTSLERLAEYDSSEALPAHEYRFRGIAARGHALAGHHEARCAEIADALHACGPSTAWEAAQRLTWSRAWPEVTGFMRRAAIAETLAHLQYLVGRGDVLVGRDEVRTYENAPERCISTSKSSSAKPAGPAS